MNKLLFHAVLFDLDGTLLNSLEDLADATNAALEAAGYPRHPVAAYQQFVGSGLEKLVCRALPEGEAMRIGQANLAALQKATGDNYARDWAVHTKPYPGIPELILALGEQDIPLGVVTNKPHAWTLRMLDFFFPSKPFKHIQGAQPDLPHKPDPTGALNSARMLHMEPASIAFVGDSNVDMQTAKNAGMIAVGADWGFRGAKELQTAGADHILYTPAELWLLKATEEQTVTP
ncbi:MAG: HAD family hydrolase [Bilophila sp.]